VGQLLQADLNVAVVLLMTKKGNTTFLFFRYVSEVCVVQQWDHESKQKKEKHKYKVDIKEVVTVYHHSPCSRMAFATLIKPATFAPESKLGSTSDLDPSPDHLVPATKHWL